MTAMRDLLRTAGVVAVLTLESAEASVPLARALAAGGLATLEITFRTGAALAALRAIADEVPDAVAGAGTVTTADQAVAAGAAGARFLVGPGLSAEVAGRAETLGLPYLPGVATASEVMAAGALGLDCLKFFPAEAMGVVATLKALAGPFPDVVFCPTGGVDAANATDYLALPNVLAVGGSWPAPAGLIAAGDYAGITGRASAARTLVAAAAG